MSAEPPNKRRRLSFNDNCPQTLPTHLQSSEAYESHFNNFSQNWDSFVANQLFQVSNIKFPNSDPKQMKQLCNKESETVMELKQEIQRLKAEKNKLHKSNLCLRDEIEIQKKAMRALKRERDSANSEKNKYKLRLKGLALMVKRGKTPNFGSVEMNKINPRMSQRIYEIKQRILSKNRKTKMKNIIEIRDTHEWISKKSLIKKLSKHIKCNESKNRNASKPLVLLSENMKMEWNYVICKFRIEKHRIEALMSGYQRGLKALMHIPKGTVMGEFVGMEYTQSEYQSIFGHSNEESIRNVYAFDCDINETKMVLDGYGLRELINEGLLGTDYSAHLLYINDCRSDIQSDVPSTEDCKHWNIDFISANVNGIPRVFLVTKCAVQRDTELMAYYGDSYDRAMRQQTEYQRFRNSMVSLVDNTILKGVDLTDEVWTIE